MNLVRNLLLITAAFIGSATFVQAHAFLDHSEPKVGATLKAAPAIVKIWFTRGIEIPPSTIAVFDAKSVQVDRKDSKGDADEVNLMTVSLPGLSPGKYRVVWNAICRDSHHTTSSFTFEVTGP